MDLLNGEPHSFKSRNFDILLCECAVTPGLDKSEKYFLSQCSHIGEFYNDDLYTPLYFISRNLLYNSCASFSHHNLWLSRTQQ